MRLNGKCAIVTGAGRGIGRAIAEKFLLEGARVLLCDVVSERAMDAAATLRTIGDVEGIGVDVSNPDDVAKLVETALTKFGRIDVLVNNAGIANFEDFLSTPLESWERTLKVNLTGTFLVSQRVAAVMVKQSFGSIVNMSSTNGLLGESGLAHYNASKAGVLLLTKTMAIELAKHNIRVNAVCPGFIATDLAGEGGMEDGAISQYNEKIPLGRRGLPMEVANAFAFLASDEASFITGTQLVVDGGQICHE